MRIKTIKSQNRRDFVALYECEHCGAIEEGHGYDDSNFHNNVIPKMECKNCGATAGSAYAPYAPKYPEGVQL